MLFAFRTYLPDPAQLPLVYLRGLDPQAEYRVEGFGETRSGKGWMNQGLSIPLGNFQSTLRRVRRV